MSVMRVETGCSGLLNSCFRSPLLFPQKLVPTRSGCKKHLPITGLWEPTKWLSSLFLLPSKFGKKFLPIFKDIPLLRMSKGSSGEGRR